MTKEEIKDKVLPVIQKYQCDENAEIDLTADLEACYGMDSLDTVQIIMDVEKIFGISIDVSVKSLKTTQDIIDEVERHILD